MFTDEAWSWEWFMTQKMQLRVILVKKPFKISTTFNCMHVFLIYLISVKHHFVFLFVHTKQAD